MTPVPKATVIVHKFASAWGQPDLSPFVFKLETYLRMAGIAYEGVPGDVRKAPKKKLPYIEHDGRVLGDSSLIITHLKTVFGDSLDAGLGARERAVAASFQAMLEEQLYFVILYQRWQEDRGWATYAPVLSEIMGTAGVPGPLRRVASYVIRKQVLKTVYAQGTGRHTGAEVDAIGSRIVTSVSDYMGENSFFLGESPRTIDATVYPFLSGIMDTPFVSATKAHAESLPHLRAYVDRMKAKYWAA
jgi:glutathione S-transferase